MLDALKYLGSEPHLMGIATLGGVVSLIVLMVTLARRIWRTRKSLSEPFRKRKLRKGRELLDDYFWARRWKKVGMSDLFIARAYFTKTLHHLGSVVFCLIISAINYNAYGESGKINLLNYLMYWAFIFLAVNDIFKMSRTFYSAFDLIQFANLELGGRALLKRRLKQIRRAWF